MKCRKTTLSNKSLTKREHNEPLSFVPDSFPIKHPKLHLVFSTCSVSLQTKFAGLEGKPTHN